MPGSQRSNMNCREEATGPQSLWRMEKEMSLSGDMHLWAKAFRKGWGRVWWLQKGGSRRGGFAITFTAVLRRRKWAYYLVQRKVETEYWGKLAKSCLLESDCECDSGGPAAWRWSMDKADRQRALQALLIWGVGGLWCSKRSPSLFLITCWMTPDGFTSCLEPRLSHLENLLVEVDSLWGWTSCDFFPLGPSPDPPPRESTGHTALDPHEPGSWGDPDEERQILWTDWQWDNRKVVRVQHPVSQVSAGNMSHHQIRTNFHLLF